MACEIMGSLCINCKKKKKKDEFFAVDSDSKYVIIITIKPIINYQLPG